MGFGNSDARSDIQPRVDVFLEHLGDEMSPRIKRDDLGFVEPRLVRWDLYGWFGQRIIGLVRGRQGSHRDRQSTVDRVRPGMSTDGIPSFDAARETGADDGSTRRCI